MVRLDCFAYLYYYFTKELHASLSEDGGKKTVTFITREGPFLRRLFVYYQGTLPATCDRHETAYMECSRNAVLSACGEDLEKIRPQIDKKRYLHAAGLTAEETRTFLQMDASDQDAYLQQITAQSEASLRRYLSSFCKDGRMNIADFGGRGYMQDRFTGHFGVQVEGYYFSVRAAGGVSTEHKRALVYVASEQLGRFSKYSHIINSLIHVYEELAMAGEGSVLRFGFDGDGNPIRIKEWDTWQESFFLKWGAKLQQQVESLTCSLMDTCRMKKGRLLRVCAWKALRFAMLKNTEEVEMMRHLMNRDETVLPGYIPESGQQYFRDFPWSVKILTAPDEYVHFFNRFQEIMWRRWWRRPLYLFVAGLFMVYTWTVVSIKLLFRFS